MINEDNVEVKRKQIDRYQGYAISGQGHITDCQTGKDIITINFPAYQEELAREVFVACMITLNTFNLKKV